MKTYTHEELVEMANSGYAFITPDKTNAAYLGASHSGHFMFIDGFLPWRADGHLNTPTGQITPEPPENG